MVCGSSSTFRRHVQEMEWQPQANPWQMRTNTGETVFARHVVMAAGQLS